MIDIKSITFIKTMHFDTEVRASLDKDGVVRIDDPCIVDDAVLNTPSRVVINSSTRKHLKGEAEKLFMKIGINIRFDTPTKSESSD